MIKLFKCQDVCRNYENHFMQALKLRRLISNDFANVWASRIDVLLTPVTLTEAPRYADFSKKDNREQCATQDYCTQPANLAGKLFFIDIWLWRLK
jgi:aspartyl-tRNA(Asn)/glutamyl-tRNA(Gln) amidotransferase subunit A